MAKKKDHTPSAADTHDTSEKKRRRKKLIGKVASAVILGSILLATGPCHGSDYELSFITVNKKPRESVREIQYREASRTAQKQADVFSHRQQATRPEFMENYYDALLLDFKAMDHQVALTQCGYCNCASCICPSVACSCIGSCSSCVVCLACSGNACTACPCPADCKACACPCSCDCDCDCP